MKEKKSGVGGAQGPPIVVNGLYSRHNRIANMTGSQPNLPTAILPAGGGVLNTGTHASKTTSAYDFSASDESLTHIQHQHLNQKSFNNSSERGAENEANLIQIEGATT